MNSFENPAAGWDDYTVHHKANELFKQIGKPMNWSRQFQNAEQTALHIAKRNNVKVDKAYWEIMQARTSWDLNWKK